MSILEQCDVANAICRRCVCLRKGRSDSQELQWLERAEHQVIQVLFELSTPFFDHLIPKQVFDPEIREQCAQSPYPCIWPITGFIMHLGIESVMPLDFIGTTCWKQCHKIPPCAYHRGAVEDVVHSITQHQHMQELFSVLVAEGGMLPLKN